MSLPTEFRKYNAARKPADKRMYDQLAAIIAASMGKEAEAKIWHGSPVWFIDGNPIVGYHAMKDCVRLLFWSGQSFKVRGLAKEGSFKAAEKRYVDAKEIKVAEVRGWIRQAKRIQWDYKNIVKRKGRLVKIGTWM
jgi:hypothetical protein